MKRTLFLVLTALYSLPLLTGCASYNARPLNSLSPDTLTSPSHQGEDLVVFAKRFTRADCKRYLDRDVMAKGYQPIQLFIQNNSDNSYVFSLNRVSLSCTNPEEVAEKVHTSTVARAVGYGAGALILWPLAIPAIIDGVGSAKANENLDNDFASKTARDQTILPHSYFNKILFTPINEYPSTFTVTLIDQHSHAIKKVTVTAN